MVSWIWAHFKKLDKENAKCKAVIRKFHINQVMLHDLRDIYVTFTQLLINQMINKIKLKT